MENFHLLGPYIIATFMSIAGLCIFVWGVLAGAFAGADEAALNFFHAEVESDRSHRNGGE